MSLMFLTFQFLNFKYEANSEHAVIFYSLFKVALSLNEIKNHHAKGK